MRWPGVALASRWWARSRRRASGARTLTTPYRETISSVFGLDTLALSDVAETEAEASGSRTAAERVRQWSEPALRAAAPWGVSHAMLESLKRLPPPLR